MSLNVHIPEVSLFTLYARGRIERKQTVNGIGTFIQFDGVILLYYKYPHHRRAYIVRNAEDIAHYPAITLPNVKQPVAVLYRAKGRKVDTLRNVYWNLEQINGSKVYTYNTIFWQKASCLLDRFEGKRSAAIKTNLMLLSKEYALHKKRGYPL